MQLLVVTMLQRGCVVIYAFQQEQDIQQKPIMKFGSTPCLKKAQMSGRWALAFFRTKSAAWTVAVPDKSGVYVG